MYSFLSSFFFPASVLSFFTWWQVWRLGGDGAGFKLLLSNNHLKPIA
jgi:hypothetical protein